MDFPEKDIGEKVYEAFNFLLDGESNNSTKKYLAQIFFEIPVEEYTLNFLTERYYAMILEILLPQLDAELVKETAKQHLNQATTIKQYFHFFRVWRKVLGPDGILALATGAKKNILHAISLNALSITKDRLATIGQIKHIAKILGWEREFLREVDYLNNGVKTYANNFCCLNCQSKGMMLIEDILVCQECGASWEL